MREYMVSAPKKIFFSFLLSAFFSAGIAVFAFTGIVDSVVFMLTLAAVFLTLFLIVFFCVNLRQNRWSADIGFEDSPDMQSADKMWSFVEKSDLNFGKKRPAVQNYAPEIPPLEYGELEELEAVEDAPPMDSGTKTIHKASPAISNLRIAFGDDDIPYLAESSGLELVDGDIDEVIRFMDDDEPPLLAVEDDAAELENIFTGAGAGGSLFRQLFAFSLSNPELLQGETGEVLYEKNGIHYISSDVLDGDEKDLNDDFAKLVESVVDKF